MGSAAKSSKFSPCTNRPIECNLCDKVYVWSYNIDQHYSLIHPNIRPECFISEDEKNKVKSLSC